MAGINVQVKKGAVDVSDYLLQYDRQTNICSGVGTFNAIFDDGLSLSPGDTFYLYEGGTQKGKYWVGTATRDVEGSISADCQDNSKWLQDYFIGETYNYAGHSSKYWIEFLCTLAKLSVTFISGAGEGYIQPYGQFFGLEPAYDAVVRMCQQSGWYFYFNGSGTCVVGSLLTSPGGYSASLVDSDILSEEIDSSDESLRNRVIIWGNNVFLTMDRRTSWDRGASDKRTVVYTNNYITDSATASEIGKKILDEYSQTISQKVYSLVGAYNIDPGDRVKCTTSVWNGVGRATTVGSRLSDTHGLQTTLILDERCPRIFGYISYDVDSEYVYVGTKSHGVYRKVLSGSTWSDYSTGITNKNIRDLKVNGGILVATTDGWEVYRRFAGDSTWTQITPDGWTEEVDGVPTDFYTTGWVAAGVGIDRSTGDLLVGYNVTSTGKAWVMQWRSSVDFTMTQVIVNGKETINIHDTDFNDTYTELTIESQIFNPTMQAWLDSGGALQGELGNPVHVYTDDQAANNGLNLPLDNVSLGTILTSADTNTIDYNMARPYCIKNNKLWQTYTTATRLYYWDLATNQETRYDLSAIGMTIDLFSKRNSCVLWVDDAEENVYLYGPSTTSGLYQVAKADLAGGAWTMLDTDIESTMGVDFGVPGFPISPYPEQHKGLIAFYADFRVGSTIGADPFEIYHKLNMYVYDLETGNYEIHLGDSLYPVGVTNNSDWYVLENQDNSSVIVPTATGFGLISGDTLYYSNRSSSTEYVSAYYGIVSYEAGVGFSSSKVEAYSDSKVGGFFQNRACIGVVAAVIREDAETYIGLSHHHVNTESDKTYYSMRIVKLPGGEVVMLDSGAGADTEYTTILQNKLYLANSYYVRPLIKRRLPALALTFCSDC
jgi:hypothetical protein